MDLSAMGAPIDFATARRNGLSVIELLVVVSIVGLLLALVLPALQAARESSRRTHCHSNLRDIGHAILQFEQVHGRLPSGGKGTDFSVNPPATVFDVQSTFMQLVTYFEESYLGSGVKPEYAYNDSAWPANQVAARNPVPLFLCPSSVLRLADPDGYGQSDYMPVVYTDIDPQTGTRNPSAIKAGALVVGGLPLARVTDGTGRTIAMLEDAGRNWEAYYPVMNSGYSDPIFSGGSAMVWNGSAQVSYSQWLAAHKLTSQGLPTGDSQTPSGNRAMNRWAEPACGGGVSGQTNSNPAHIVNPINGNDAPAGGPVSCLWSTTNCGPNEEGFSWHPLGAHALMCDGSARFVGKQINPVILRYMVTPDEQVPYDDGSVP
jgi:prepilin-type N-terminal cleavage/methylation domain-containing protein